MQDPPDSLSRNLGGYDLVERVGSGGMGVVYRAIDRRSGTTVAVKVIHDHLRSDPTFIDRFRSEAHLASLLASPYIVRVIEFGSDKGEYFLATEYVEGQKLSDLIAGKRLSVEESLAIGVQVAMALQAAAAHRVVHRDVKPDNIIITGDKAVKLMDFGVARLSYVETRQLFLGTVAYAAPEQFRGQTTVQSDIYSLGVVLFQMLVGELPFKGDTLSSLIRMHDEVPPPMEKLDWASPALRDVVAKCLEKDPAKRYQDPSELVEALRRVRTPMATTPPDDATWIAETMTGLAAETDTVLTDGQGTVVVPVSNPGMVAPVAAAAGAGAAAGLAGGASIPPRRPPTAVNPAPKESRGPRTLLIAGGAALAAFIVAGLVVLAFSGGGGNDKKEASSAGVAPTTSAAGAGLDVSPTAVQPTAVPPTAVPTVEPTPLPPAPTPVPEPVQAALPDRTDCNAIRGTPYRSGAERDFFVANCSAPAPTAVPAAPSGGGAVAPPVVAPSPVPQVAPTPVPAAPAATFGAVNFSDGSKSTQSGGTLQSCNPASLVASVSFSNLVPPKEFVGTWTLVNGTTFRQSFTQTATRETAVFQVQNQASSAGGSFTPLTAGSYSFALSVDGRTVSQGSFRLSC